MNRDFLLKLYDRLTSLVEKLPGGLQKPILRELVPIRELFLEQRPARLLLLGHPSPEELSFLETLLRANARPAPPENPALPSPDAPPPLPPLSPVSEPVAPPFAWESTVAESGWRTHLLPRQGGIEILDARNGSDTAWLRAALQAREPDIIVLFHDPSSPGAASELSAMTSALAEIHALGIAVPLVAVGLGPLSSTGVEVLRPALHGRPELAGQSIRILAWQDSEPDKAPRAVGEAVCAFLPNPSRLEFALLLRIRSAQVDIARSLLKSFTAVCGVIGMQPIPLADLPILSSLQSLMVALIAHVSGRQMGPRVLTEFFGAVGISIGAGMLLREGARALIKIVPFWGHAVSGLVAGAGTYAIGRAAIAYFIEEIPARETRRLFKTLRPGRSSFRKKKLSRASRQLES